MEKLNQEKVDEPKSPLQGDRGLHVLGIRHHGPGSARSVRNYLEELKPDIVLVEGPPEADAILQWALHEELKPPVALLCYVPDNPRQSVFYPFAEFSPEWQAILFAKQQNIPVRFFDLPVAHQFALENKEDKGEKEEKENGNEGKEKKEENGAGNDDSSSQNEGDAATAEPTEPVVAIRKDPIAYLAEAAGYEDGEVWWEQMFEYRRNCEDVFNAVTEAMQSLREHLPAKEDRREALREAYMRRMIRQAQRELYTTVAVVCGAWHAPALLNPSKQKDDDALLKGLPKTKVDCTWIPWTYNRLSYASGYGAGIPSPGWYEHTWQHPHDHGTRWMSKVAALFRKHGMDTSVAHVIEAVRLSENLASLRGLNKAGLEELNEATLSVLCNGETILLQLLHDELIVSPKIGEVPEDIPKPPLQVDIEKTQKTLRLPATADFKDYTLDLRKETDLARSVFLHRLQLLDIRWGQSANVSSKGTFKEQWRLQWSPELSVQIIEKGAWGNTVEEAAAACVVHGAKDLKSLLAVADRLQEALPAELPLAVDALVRQLNNLSAASADVLALAEVVPPLVTIVRYGNVRKTDADLVLQIVSGLAARVCVGLLNAVTGLADEAATERLETVQAFNEALALLQEESLTADWQKTLRAVSAAEGAAPVISGYATRLLFDAKATGEALAKIFHYRMSAAAGPAKIAAWLEGFLRGSGSLLLVDNDLWALVNNWVASLDETTFTQALPLLRRTFAAFTQPERRKLGEKAKSGGASGLRTVQQSGVDEDRGRKGLPVVLQLLGLSQAGPQT